MKKLLVMIMFIFSITSSGMASEDTFEQLIKAKSLKCQFGPGASANWKSSNVKIELNRFDTTLFFDSIDLKTQKARLIGNQGAVDIIVLPSVAGISFIEQTGFGSINITTVFSSYAKGKAEFIAVTSRHISIPGGNPFPSQYHGTCKVWE